jgi:hypothetical protein
VAQLAQLLGAKKGKRNIEATLLKALPNGHKSSGITIHNKTE